MGPRENHSQLQGQVLLREKREQTQIPKSVLKTDETQVSMLPRLATLGTAASLLNSSPAEIPSEGGSISIPVMVGHRGDHGHPGDRCLPWPQGDGAVCVLQHLEFSSWSVTYEPCKLGKSLHLPEPPYHPCLSFPTWKPRMSALSHGWSVTNTLRL